MEYIHFVIVLITKRFNAMWYNFNEIYRLYLVKKFKNTEVPSIQALRLN